jgi:hypothetical protein
VFPLDSHLDNLLLSHLDNLLRNLVDTQQVNHQAYLVVSHLDNLLVNRVHSQHHSPVVSQHLSLPECQQDNRAHYHRLCLVLSQLRLRHRCLQ